MEQNKLPNITHILSALMFEKKIKMIDLAQQTGVPQSTLSRLLSGSTVNPHRSSLEPLADFFKVTINQLMGLEPICFLKHLGNLMTSASGVPLLTWEQIPSWLTHPSDFVIQQYIQVDTPVGDKSFAVAVEDASMEPQFPRGAILVVDTQKPVKDRCFIVISMGEYNKVLFRQLLTDGLCQYLRALSPDFSQFQMVALSPQDKILGVVVQARHNYFE